MVTVDKKKKSWKSRFCVAGLIVYDQEMSKQSR